MEYHVCLFFFFQFSHSTSDGHSCLHYYSTQWTITIKCTDVLLLFYYSALYKSADCLLSVEVLHLWRCAVMISTAAVDTFLTLFILSISVWGLADRCFLTGRIKTIWKIAKCSLLRWNVKPRQCPDTEYLFLMYSCIIKNKTVMNHKNNLYCRTRVCVEHEPGHLLYLCSSNGWATQELILIFNPDD